MGVSGKQVFTVLIADRNRHVSDFLRRELEAEDFLVRIAKDGEKLLTMIRLSPPPDLVILDPDIPYPGDVPLIDLIGDLIPPIPFIVYTFLADFERHRSLGPHGLIVEKRGDIDCLKTAIRTLLEHRYPERFRGRIHPREVGTEKRPPSA